MPLLLIRAHLSFTFHFYNFYNSKCFYFFYFWEPFKASSSDTTFILIIFSQTCSSGIVSKHLPLMNFHSFHFYIFTQPKLFYLPFFVFWSPLKKNSHSVSTLIYLLFQFFPNFTQAKLIFFLPSFSCGPFRAPSSDTRFIFINFHKPALLGSFQSTFVRFNFHSFHFYISTQP